MKAAEKHIAVSFQKAQRENMLFGQYELSLDGDRNLAIPQSLYEAFKDGLTITRGFDHNLVLMSNQTFGEINERVSGLNIADPLARLLRRLILGNAATLTVSERGKLTIPEELMSYASLEKDVILVGQGDYCEVWAPDYWEQQTATLLDSTANAGRFAQLNLALH